ncbi:MAG: cysteine desulfurase family protein [Deinococcales bacterium]
MNQIYLDYAATTPLDPAVFESILPFLREDFGNASSLHSRGQKVRAAVESAREQLAFAIGAKRREIIFTSGATEAANQAIRMIAKAHPQGHIITSSLEHAASLSTCRQLSQEGYEVSILKPDDKGEITPQILSPALKSNTVLVALMLVNNETGVISDLAQLAELSHQVGAYVFCDAVQAFGTLALNVKQLGIDMLSLSAHKIYGPKGIGALYVREGLELQPLLSGGEQERGFRAGTLNSPAIVGFGKAAELAHIRLAEDSAKLYQLRDALSQKLLSFKGIKLNAAKASRGPKHINIQIAEVDGEAMLMALDQEGVLVSAGSACAAGSIEPSHVLLAMGLSKAEAKASLRFSLGRGVDMNMIDEAVERFDRVLARCREAFRA